MFGISLIILDSEIRKMLERGLYGMGMPCSILVNDFDFELEKNRIARELKNGAKMRKFYP